MANETVIKSGECVIANQKYPLSGPIRRTKLNRFPGKVNFGDASYDSELVLSNWIINDQRGGLLIEEMEEDKDAARYWWSTAQTGFKGHVTLRGLATAATSLASSLLDTGTFSGFTDTGTDWTNETNVDDGDTSTEATGTTAGASTYSGYLNCAMTSANICGIRIYIGGTVTNVLLFEVQAYHDGQWNNVEPNSGTVVADNWRAWAYDHDGVTGIQIRFRSDGVGAGELDIGEINYIAKTGGSASTPVKFVNFNDQLYLAAGPKLFKLNAGGTAFDPIMMFPDTVTDVKTGPGSNVYFLFGGAVAFHWYMDANDEFWSCPLPYGDLIASWSSGLYFFSKTTGSLRQNTDPGTQTGGDSDRGNITDNGLAVDDVQRLGLYRDAAGDTIIYASTKQGLFAHDDGNQKWLQTELAMPDQTTTGLGFTKWREKSYTSAGLDVMTYQTGGSGTFIDSAGLSNDDGLPQLRGGEVIQFAPGYNEFFALVDSTYEGTTSRSSVMGFDGNGWRLWWEAGANNVTMYCGIVSSKVSYRLWFATSAGIYSIPLQSNIRNPKKISTFAYETTGVHITPWFDAGTQVFAKTAQKITLFAKDTTANQTIQVSYRIDHSSTAIGTVGSEFTSLGTLVAADDGAVREIVFASGAGLSFKSIQFRFDLARITTDSNPEYFSPDLQAFVLSYSREVTAVWAYTLTLDLASADRVGSNPKALYDALVTAVEAGTLQQFIYRDGKDSSDEKYVFLDWPGSLEESGETYPARIAITATEP